MAYDYAIKIRIYPNKIQKDFFKMNFGCCRFVCNIMIDERKEIYQLYKNDKEKLDNHKYRTEKQYKEIYPFLKEADSICLQQTRMPHTEHLNWHLRYRDYIMTQSLRT